MKNYNEIFRELREDKDKTQAEIAEILNITRPQYNLYETGKRQFKIEHICKLCLYYDVSSDYVLGLPKGLNRFD
ncbi:MAG: helix-turn-helix transcriptional regulator [Clostridia bacterium]|nr:helix-turn-helix transcriptional regulator [Clostridia bacterium]MBP3705899.1 helix-turn-helix transcriptional regulator [Clostridia bacterium]